MDLTLKLLRESLTKIRTYKRPIKLFEKIESSVDGNYYKEKSVIITPLISSMSAKYKDALYDNFHLETNDNCEHIICLEGILKHEYKDDEDYSMYYHEESIILNKDPKWDEIKNFVKSHISQGDINDALKALGGFMLVNGQIKKKTLLSTFKSHGYEIQPLPRDLFSVYNKNTNKYGLISINRVITPFIFDSIGSNVELPIITHGKRTLFQSELAVIVNSTMYPMDKNGRINKGGGVDIKETQEYIINNCNEEGFNEINDCLNISFKRFKVLFKK